MQLILKMLLLHVKHEYPL